jgi:biopolymer transport protein ExbB
MSARMNYFDSAVLPLAVAPALVRGAGDQPMTNLWQIIVAGGPVMWPLGGLSVLGLMLIFGYLITLRRGAVVSANYMHTADALLRTKDLNGLLAISNRHNEAIAGVMERTLHFMTKNPGATVNEAREIAMAEGVRLSGLWNQRISYLSDIGSLAPMVGLFGTVLGMIKSFTGLASEVVASRPAILAGGVSEALVATAAGLLIGVPAMVAYAYFRGRVQVMISDLEAASTVLIAQLGILFPSKTSRD